MFNLKRNRSMPTRLQRTIIIFAAVLAGIAHANAQPQMIYRDLIRPHGQPRSDAIHEADLDYCYGQTGASREQPDTPAFKQCMRGRGYRWLSTHMVGTPARSATITYNHDSKDPAVGWHWEGGNRVCHNDCDNDEIPGSGFTCRDVTWMGSTARQCTRQN
jgi:hypothetical protein